MEKPQKRTGSLFLLLLAVLISSWGNCVFAQKPVVTLTADDKTVAPDMPVTITVTTNISGTIKVDYPLELTVDYNMMNGMEQKMDPSTGKIKTYYYIQQSGSFTKEGTYSFYASVRYKGRSYKSNKLTIKVSEDADEDEHAGYNSTEPVFGIIEAKKTTVYEGEPLLLKAKAISRLDINRLEGYVPFRADKNAEQHEFQNERYEIERSRYKGNEVLILEYGKQLLFPIATGKCKIQPFEMALQYRGTFFDKVITFRSSSAVITIKPLPAGAPKDFIGAVGIYDLAMTTGKLTLKQGDVFSLTLVVHGLGNLHNTNAPVLDLPAGCAIYGDPERREDFVFTDDGVEGSITYVYNIQVTNSGKIAFAAPSISYFNPVSADYVTVKTEAFTLDVAPDASFHPLVDSTKPAAGHSDKGTGNTPSSTASESGMNAWLITGIAAPVCLAGLLFLLFIRRRKQSSAPKPSPEQPAAAIFVAPKVSNDFWAEAIASKNDADAFSILLPKAIVQRLEKKLKTEGLSREKVFSLLTDRDPSAATTLREIVEICDHHRYGFGDTDLHAEELLARAEGILNAL